MADWRPFVYTMQQILCDLQSYNLAREWQTLADSLFARDYVAWHATLR